MEDSIPMHRSTGEERGVKTLVTSGLHGDERAAREAAKRVANIEPRRGELIVMPEINQEAIRDGSHTYSGGDLNRHFPPYKEPTSKLARYVWSIIQDENPDVLIDLHTSKGILREDDDGVGQAVFHTPQMFDLALEQRLQEVNAQHILSRGFTDSYFFRRGWTSGDSTLLTHKTGSDLGVPTYLVEATRKDTTRRERTEWEYQIVLRLLELHGVI